MSNIKDNWEKVLTILEKEVTAVSFDLWIKTLEPFEIQDNCLIIIASSETAKERCMSSHSTVLKLAIAESFDDVESFEILSPDEKEEYLSAKIPSTTETKITEADKPAGAIFKFNPKYTFDNFVVGKSNQFVYAASRGVADTPFVKHNPLFIYGGVGLGKTHLLHAIGNYLNKYNPSLKVLYVTCEQFTNDYINSLYRSNREKNIVEFREKYRNVDVLMVDDIQFITNKEGTQEEFFHTFNDLYQNNKQIIIASDRSPKEIATLSDRLKSRFSSGLIQDIQTPDYETRVAILKKKAQQENYSLEENVICYLAEKVDTNIRELEGSLSKVCFYANLKGKRFATMEDALEALQEDIIDKGTVSIDLIVDTVCKYYNVTKVDMMGKKKNKEIVDPRQVAMYLSTELMDLPLSSIGKMFGGRDHTTIIHARDKIAVEIKQNGKIKVDVSDIRAMILNK